MCRQEKRFAMNNGEAPCTFRAYTPVWEEDGKCFKAWLEIGAAWRDEHGKISSNIHSLPINPEETFTGAICFIVAGESPPSPLTISKDEFLEAHFDRS